MGSIFETRVIRILSLFFTLLFLLASCQKDTLESKDPQTLYVALSSEPRTLDPRKATDAVGMRLSHLLYSSIVRLGPELKIVGEAAESWSYKNKEYRFTLRDGLFFSNGREVTDEDILVSIDEYKKDTSAFAAAFKSIALRKIEKHENRRVLVLQLNQFSANFLTDMTALKILPIQELKASPDLLVQKPLGSGPYTFVSSSPNDYRLKAQKNPYLTPTIPNLVFKIVRDDNTRVQKLMRGDIDIVQGDIAPEKVGFFEEKKKFNIQKFPGLSMTYLLLNLKDPLFQKVEVRKALLQAIHVEDIIKYKLRGLAQTATSILSPENPFFHPELKSIPFDREEAKKTFKKFGLLGKEISLKTSNAGTAVDNGRLIASDLEKAGLNIKMQSFEWATFYSDITKANFQMATMKWVGATDPDIYRMAYHSKEVPPGRNRGSYINKELDLLLDAGLIIEDQDQRRAHYLRVQEIIQEDLPSIPLWYETQIAVSQKSISHYTPSLNGDFTAFAKATKQGH